VEHPANPLALRPVIADRDRIERELGLGGMALVRVVDRVKERWEACEA
jgi:hypothetical protein